VAFPLELSLGGHRELHMCVCVCAGKLMVLRLGIGGWGLALPWARLNGSAIAKGP